MNSTGAISRVRFISLFKELVPKKLDSGLPGQVSPMVYVGPNEPSVPGHGMHPSMRGHGRPGTPSRPLPLVHEAIIALRLATSYYFAFPVNDKGNRRNFKEESVEDLLIS